MNAVIEAIRKRRSVRSYRAKPVPRDIVNAIIDADNEAPSAMNSQQWRFVVIEGSGVKKKLLSAAFPNARKVLGLKEDETIFGPLLLGYSKGHPGETSKKGTRGQVGLGVRWG